MAKTEGTDRAGPRGIPESRSKRCSADPENARRAHWKRNSAAIRASF